MKHVSVVNWRGLLGAALDDPRSPVVVLGIDLGTTYSTATRIEWSGNPADEPIEDAIPVPQWDGASRARRVLVPSVVAVAADGRVVVGEEARALPRRSSKPLIPGHNYFEATKNDIGTSKRYPKAAAGLTSPTEVAAEILRFIVGAIRDEFPNDKYDRIVVTVPASFQLTQREETLKAAGLAELDATGEDLLDEPVAALLAWLSRDNDISAEDESSVVIDFGGGTCDIAILNHRLSDIGVEVEVAGTSRYTRLGGADIDRALATQHLLPRLAAANGHHVSDWAYAEKAAVLVPRLAEAAEELKRRINQQMSDRRRIGRQWDDAVVHGSRDVGISWNGEDLRLPAAEITLSASEFTQILEPYLSPDRLFPIHGEYFETASVFAPLNELMDRAGMDSAELDNLLLAGGSSYLVPVRESLETHLGMAGEYVTPDESAEQQTEISRGAALQAFALAVSNRPLAQLNSGEVLEVQHVDGWETLVPAKAPLPWHHIVPKEEMFRVSDASKPLRLELRRGTLGLSTTEIAVPLGVQTGDPFSLEFGMDGGGVLAMSVRFATGEAKSFTVERPGSYVANPGSHREQILELEGELGLPGLTPAREWAIRCELTDLYRQIGHNDKALTQATWLVRNARAPSEQVFANDRRSLVLSERGDVDAAVESYRNAIAAGGSDYLKFNLAFILRDHGRFEEALPVVDELVAESGRGADWAIRGSVLKGLNRNSDATAAFERARAAFGHPRTATSFERSWMRYAAKQLGDKELLEEIRATERESDDTAMSGALPAKEN